MRPEPNAQSLHCLLHPLAMPANDSSVEHGGGLGDDRDVLADPTLEQFPLRGERERVHGESRSLQSSRSDLGVTMLDVGCRSKITILRRG
jgi:hypothetical protein